MAGKVKDVPWYEHNSESELKDFYESDEEGFRLYIAGRWEEWNEEQAKLEPGMPNKLAFEFGENDVLFQSKLRRWENEQSQESFYEKHKPPVYPPMDRDFLGLASKHQKDKQTASEIIRNKEFIGQQMREYARLKGMGEGKRAGEALARAGMMERQNEDLRKKHPYNYEVEYNQQVIDHGLRELEGATKLSPLAVENSRQYLEGLTKTFNASFDGEFSFIIDSTSPYDEGRSGEPRILKIEHPGHKASEIQKYAEASNSTTLDHLLRIGYGKQSPEEKEEVPEEETPSPGEFL